MEKFLEKSIINLETLFGFLFYKTGPGVIFISGGTTLISSFFISEGESYPEFALPIMLVGVFYLLFLIFVGILWFVMSVLKSYLYEKE